MKLELFSIVWNLGSVGVTVVLHSVGTFLTVAERRHMFRLVASQRYKLIRGQLVVAIIVIELLILHLVEIGFWGVCVRAVGLFNSFGASLYFAGMSYTSLGYTGALPPSRIGFSEVLIASVGLLMFGWSIGILVTTVVEYEKVALGWDPNNPLPRSPSVDNTLGMHQA
jgi:hypothetical protein